MTHFYVTGNYQWRSAKFASQVGDVIEVYASPPHAPNLFYERTEAGLQGPLDKARISSAETLNQI